MKTAMLLLLKNIENYRIESGNDSIDIDLLELSINEIYLNLETQQIIDSYNDGQEFSFNKFGTNAERYYNETFNNH
jgi:hypothetical protein